MASSIAANKAELLAIANAVATEKMIDKSIVIEALEEAIQRAARARYGAENDIRAKLDTQTGDLRLWRVVEVVEDVEDYFKQVDLKQADKLQKGAVVGDFIVDPLIGYASDRTTWSLGAARAGCCWGLRSSRWASTTCSCRRPTPPKCTCWSGWPYSISAGP